VGSRTLRKGSSYCSNICCMNTIKSTLLIKEHYPDIDIKVFYIDIRSSGKGFEDLYRRSRKEGVQYIRGLPGNIEETGEKGLMAAVENIVTGKVEIHDLDMLVLSQGIQPAPSTQRLQESLGLQLTSDGFYLEAHPKLLPVDAATRGIFFAGCAEGPKDIKESVTQGSAAAARAIRLMHKGSITTEPIISQVDPELCKFCGKCAEVCPYNAISIDTKKRIPAEVNTASCAGCGTCAAECVFDAISMNHFTDRQILGQVDAMLEEKTDEKILVFACNWCSYAGADNAGVSRFQYPPNIRLIRTMCSGRVDEKFIWEGFERGAPIILVSGCHIGDCHYIDANQWTVKRIQKIHKKMARMDIRPDRLRLEWVSAAEGVRFAEIMRDLERLRKEVTSEEIGETVRILKERKNNSK